MGQVFPCQSRDGRAEARTNWELNRHFQFALLAKAYYATGEEKLEYIKTEDSVAIQLREFTDMERWLQKRLSARAAKDVKEPLSEDWASLVKNSIAFDASNPQSVMAVKDQAKALEIISSRRLSVLTGPAGTGKTTVVKAFLSSREVIEEGVLLLAPTGKARVRLGSMASNTQALTVAQFLTKQGFFDGSTMSAYIPAKDKQRKYAGAKLLVNHEITKLF